MARKKLVHIHSNVLNKMPKPTDLNVGELAVNNNVDNEFISLKNTDEEVVRFSSDKQLVSWMNEKEVFPVSGDVSTDIASNTSQIIIRNNQYADSATTGADVVNHSGAVIDTSAFALSGGNVTFNSVTVNDISAVTINGKDANSLGDITNITYTPNDEIEDGVSGNTLEFAQSGNNNTVSVNLVFDDELNNTSVNAVQNKVLNDVLEEMEEVTAASLNDLNDRVLELENTPDLHVTGGRFSGGTLYIEQENGPTIEIGGISGGEGSDGNNYPTSLELNSNNVLVLGRNGLSDLTADLSTLDTGNAPTSGRVEAGTGAQSGSTFINFYNGTTKLFSVNADDLMIDGMVESVSIGQAVPEGESVAVDCLIVDWNTAAGDKTTNIPLTSIFNPDNYYTKQDIQNNYYTKQDVYTKQEVNNALGDDFIPSSVTSSVTEVINGLEDRVGDLENKQDIHVVSGSFSQASATLTLTMSSGSPITVSGMVTGGGDEPIVAYNNYVTAGTVGNDGVITLVHNVDGDHSVQDAPVTGLEAYINSKTSGFVETADDKHVIGGSVNNQGIIVVEQNGVSPNVELSGLPSYVDSKLNGKYLPLSGGTVSGNTTFTSDLVASGSNGITATKFVKNGGTDTQVLMADGSVKELGAITGDNFVSGGSVDAQGVIHLANTDPTNNGEITGLSDYVSSVTQNFITADQDKYVSAGTVGNDGVITLNLRHGGTAPVTGLEAYVNGKLDGNDYVVSGSVNSSTGIITLKNTDPAKDGRITGLSRYVGDYVEDYMSEHAPVGDWVDISGDTMTGPLAISGHADGGELVDELFGITNTYTNKKILSVMNQAGSDHVEITNSSFIVNSTLSVDAGGNIEISGDTDIDGALTVTDGILDKGDLRVSGETRVQNGVYAGNGFHYYSPNTSGHNSNSYVLLAGGGVKPLSDFTTGGGETVEGEKYLESATLNPSTGEIEFGIHEGDNVTLSGLSTYVSDKANSAAYNVASRYLPLAGGELNSTYSEHNNPVLKINGSTGSTSGSPVLNVHGYSTGNPLITDATTTRTITSNGRVLANGFVHYKFKDSFAYTEPVGVITLLNAHGGTYQLITGETVDDSIIHADDAINIYSGTAELRDSISATTNSLNHLSGVTVNLSGKTDEVSAKTDNNTITIHGLETNFSGLSHSLTEFSGNVKNNYTTKSGVTDIVKAELSGSSKEYLDSTYASKDSVTDLSGSVADISGKTNNNSTSIGDLRSDFSGLTHDLTYFSGTVRDNYVTKSGFTDAVKAELSGGSKTYLDATYATTTSVNDLSGSVSDLNNKTNEISGKTNDNTTGIGNLRSDFSGITHSFADFSGTVRDNYATKSGVTDAVKAELSGGSKSYLDATYATTSSVNDLRGDVADVSGKTNDNTTSIGNLRTDFSGLTHDLEYFSGTVRDNYATKTGVTDAVKSELSGGSKTYLDSTYASTGSVNSLNSDIADLRTSATTNADDISNLNTGITSLSGLVGDNYTTLNNKFSEYVTSADAESNYVKQDKLADGVKDTLSADTATRTYLNDTYVSNNNLNNAIATSTTITNIQSEVDSKLSNGETIIVSAGTASNMTGSTVASDKIEFVNGNDSTTIDASGVEIKDGLNQMVFNEDGITFANVNSNPRIIFTGGTWVERSGITAPNANISAITSNDITTDELEATSARTTNLTADTENVGILNIGGLHGPVVAELKEGTPNGTFSFSGSVKSTGGFVYNNPSVSGSSNYVLTTNGSYLPLSGIANSIANTNAFNTIYVQRDGDVSLTNDYKTTGDVSANTLGGSNLVVDGNNVAIDTNNVSIETGVYSVKATAVGASEYHLGGSSGGDIKFYGYNMTNPSLTILDPSYQDGSKGTIVKLINSKMEILNSHGDAVGFVGSTNGTDSEVSATTVYTSNGSVQTSDSRLKENVSSISDEAIANVAKVDLKSFNMIGDKDKTVKYGVIAQELNDAGLTNIAKEGPDGYYGVDYTSFLILKIAQLEKKIKELEEKLK